MRCNKCDQPTDGQTVLVLCAIRDGHPPFQPEYVGYTWHVACAPIDGPGREEVVRQLTSREPK
jgi:hypothetical protein